MRKWGDSSPRHWFNLDSEPAAWIVVLAGIALSLVWIGWR